MKTWRWMITVATAGLLAAACSGSSTPEDEDDEGTGGSGGDPTTTTVGPTTSVTMPTTTTMTGTPMGCYRDDQALVAPGTVAETGKMECDSMQIDGFFQECFNGGDCAAFQTANETCVGCLLGGGGDHYPPLLLGNDMGGSSTVYVNVYACESLAQGLNQCAMGTSGFSHCVNTACETCMSDPEEQACAQEAQGPNGICTQAVTVPMECEAILGLDLMNLSAECAGTDFQSLYTSSANYICGAGAGGT